MNIVYVNEKDVVIGSGSISHAIDNGIRHRIARVFITNSKGELLIQRRSDAHLSLPGRWDQSAAGHVDEGETYELAASRELFEEMGIRGVKLESLDKYYAEETDETITKKRFNQIFCGTFDGEPKIDEDEVSDYRWISPEQLQHEMAKTPQNFTEGFIEAFKRFRKQTSR